MLFGKPEKNIFSTMSILIVEPVDNMRMTIASMLSSLAFKEILQAKNGLEAKTLIERNKVDFILSEYHLDKLSGVDLLIMMRKGAATSRIPFIILSSAIEHDEVLYAIKNGVSEYVVKPFSVNTLKQRIINSINNPIKSTATTLASKKESSLFAKKEQPVILIVDDVANNIHVIADILRADYKVKGVISGEKALKICRSDSPPDLILLDIMMPEMDGMELCKILKSDPLTQHIAIIFLTAVEQAEKIVEGLSLGAVDYITKPINPSITQARVKTHINTINNQKLLRLQLDTMVENIQLRNEFDRIMQNDLRTPISNLFLAIDDISKSTKNPKSIASIAKNLKHSCTSLSQQVDNMLVLYKLEDGSYKFTPEIFDFSEIILNAIECQQLLIERKKLEINTNFEDCYKVTGEKLLTSSIVSSLLQNAIEAAPRGSAIHISIEKEDTFQKLTLKNHGGIPKEVRENFFDKYVTSGKKDAKGLGTYSAKLMTEVQNGVIEFDSSIAQETFVFVSLPAYQ